MLKLDKSKLKTTLIALLSSIWVLGLGATLVLSLLLPNFLNKYKINLIESVDRSETRELAFFEDYDCAVVAHTWAYQRLKPTTLTITVRRD